MKASYIFGVFLISFFIGVAALVSEMFGFTYGRYFAYVAIPFGIATLSVGGVSRATGALKDDLKRD